MNALDEATVRLLLRLSVMRYCVSGLDEMKEKIVIRTELDYH